MAVRAGIIDSHLSDKYEHMYLVFPNFLWLKIDVAIKSSALNLIKKKKKKETKGNGERKQGKDKTQRII